MRYSTLLQRATESSHRSIRPFDVGDTVRCINASPAQLYYRRHVIEGEIYKISRVWYEERHNSGWLVELEGFPLCYTPDNITRGWDPLRFSLLETTPTSKSS